MRVRFHPTIHLSSKRGRALIPSSFTTDTRLPRCRPSHSWEIFIFIISLLNHHLSTSCDSQSLTVSSKKLVCEEGKTPQEERGNPYAYAGIKGFKVNKHTYTHASSNVPWHPNVMSWKRLMGMMSSPSLTKERNDFSLSLHFSTSSFPSLWHSFTWMKWEISSILMTLRQVKVAREEKLFD